MYNWSVNEQEMRRKDPQAFQIWRLEQLINYGLSGEKISEKLLKKHWRRIFMDKPTREYLEFLLWPQKSKS